MTRPLSSAAEPVDPERDETRGRTIFESLARKGLEAMRRHLPLPFLFPAPSVSIEQIVGKEERVVMNACVTNCGSRCPLKCHVVDGVIRWISQEDNDATGDDTFGAHQVRGCLRGRSARRRVYAPDRLQYPMKRIGARGEGRFERISWDEAIRTVGDALRRTIDTYGNDAIYYQYGSGSTGYNFAGRSSCHRFLKVIGGYLEFYNTYSTGQIRCALPFTYGDNYIDHRSLSTEISNARLCVFFGYNPSELRMSGGGEDVSGRRAAPARRRAHDLRRSPLFRQACSARKTNGCRSVPAPTPPS